MINKVNKAIQQVKATPISSDGPTVVTIGTFDGVHIGHRKIIKRLVESAEGQQLKSTVLTFFPHPRMVLQKGAGVKLINTIEERKAILNSTGIDQLIVYPFTKEFSRLSAREYIENVLVKQLKAKKVIIGYDHHFGRNRTADINDLKTFGKTYGFEVEEIPEQDMDEVAVSSTKIRKALESGNVEKANKYLGQPFMLTGKIVRGKGLGKDFGYPTANLNIKEDYKLVPKKGVYISQANIDGKHVYGMTNIGTNPTVGGKEKTIETYFFDFEQDLYGKELQIDLLKRIREEKNFDNIDDLKCAMKADEEYTKTYLQNFNH